MLNFIKKLKATKQHLRFLSKFDFSRDEILLNDDFFDSFSKAFIIAPHMDDEIHGSFALIKKLLELKKQVTIIYCVSALNGIETEKRINESKEVFPSVSKIYLGLDDSKLEAEILNLKEKLVKILENEDSIFVFPEFAAANHKDHNAVNKVMNEICSEKNHELVLKTELIVPISRNCWLPIEDFEEKCSEIKKYKTQKNHVDYIKISEFLAKSANKKEFREHYAK